MSSRLSLNIPPQMLPSPLSPLEPINYGPPRKDWYGTIRAVAFFPDGKRIVTAGHSDNSTRVWDLETKTEDGNPFRGHGLITLAVSVSKNGVDVVTGGADNRVCLWKEDDRTRTPIILFAGLDPKFQIMSVAFNATTYPLLVASGGSEGVVNVWNIKDAEYPSPATRIRIQGSRSHITSLQFSPSDPSQLAVTSNPEKLITVYNALNGQKLFELAGHTTTISSFAWFPGGQRLVSTGDSIRIWDTRMKAQTGEPLFGHGRFVKSITVSPDGKYIASGSNDGTVRVWNAATREQIGTPISVSGIIIVRFSLDSKSLLTVSKDKDIGIQRWPMEHLEVEEGLKLTKDVVDAFIQDSKEFQDDLHARLDDEFNNLRNTHAEQIDSISDMINQAASENQARIGDLDSSLTNSLNENLSLATEHKTEILAIKFALIEISKSSENNFNDLKDSIVAVNAKYREIHSNVQNIKEDIQNLANQFKDLNLSLKTMIQKSGGPGPGTNLKH